MPHQQDDPRAQALHAARHANPDASAIAHALVHLADALTASTRINMRAAAATQGPATDAEPAPPDIVADVAAAIAAARAGTEPPDVLRPVLEVLSHDVAAATPQGGDRCPGIISSAGPGGPVRCLLADRHEDQRSSDPRHLAFASGHRQAVRWSDHPDQPPAPTGVA